MIFVDTGFLFALVSKRDAHHKRVVEVFREFQNRRLADHLLTTNHVVAEAITLTLKIGHSEAVRLGDQLHGERLARIHWATPDEEGAAFNSPKAPRGEALHLRAWRLESPSSPRRSGSSGGRFSRSDRAGRFA